MDRSFSDLVKEIFIGNELTMYSTCKCVLKHKLYNIDINYSLSVFLIRNNFLLPDSGNIDHGESHYIYNYIRVDNGNKIEDEVYNSLLSISREIRLLELNI
jgi:hypothetical protein